MSRHLRKMKTDESVKNVMSKDLSEYISPENFSPSSFEFEAKDKSITLRMSEHLLKKIQSLAEKRHISYQKMIRQAIEKFVIEAA